MYYVSKNLKSFATTHRLGKGYPNKCKNLHGHNYFVEVTLKSEILDQYGMVIDFGDIKKYFDTWLQENWDHATLVSADDGSLLGFLQSEDQRKYVVPSGNNSTAEWMSKFLFVKFSQILQENNRNIKMHAVKVWETKDSYATYMEQ